jgi:hypothetical protein
MTTQYGYSNKHAFRCTEVKYSGIHVVASWSCNSSQERADGNKLEKPSPPLKKHHKYYNQRKEKIKFVKFGWNFL